MKITLDSDFYTEHAIENTIMQFTDFLFVTFITENDFFLEMMVKEEHSLRASEIINTFLNNLLILSLQEKITYEC